MVDVFGKVMWRNVKSDPTETVARTESCRAGNEEVTGKSKSGHRSAMLDEWVSRLKTVRVLPRSKRSISAATTLLNGMVR